VELWVADQGPGVPEEYRERIFEKYAQIQMRDKGVSVNRGLGLTFCSLAIEAHGGTIWVDQAAGGGACFRALLPAPLDAEGTAENDSSARESALSVKPA
jgi:signal transduction histidine kinase